ncbi:helix-turn-helix domain-containing protein [Sphingobium sp. sgz301303]
MDIKKLVGANVLRRRRATRMSQEAVAERMGVDRAYIGAIERGEQNITLHSLWGLSEALGIHPRDFFDEETLTDIPE